MAMKQMSREKYEEFNRALTEAESSNINIRKAEVDKAVKELESGMEYLAVTGVEDSLQDDVAKTLLNLRKAGI
jgi:phospholipid-translocating ATPase